MATMVDFERACRAAGLPMDPTVPDFTSNGHDGVLLLADPRLGYWHHTVATVLQSVYSYPGQPDWRPDIPSPRANVYAARARPAGCGSRCQHQGRAHLVFVSAGKAHHAGMANLGRVQTARAGRVSAALPDAAGLVDDYAYASFEAVGLEVDWVTGEGWPADLLDLVAAVSAVAVRTFGWSGPGHWIHHRQATHRKLDMAYRGDLWSRTQQAIDGGDEMSAADVAEIAAKLDKIYTLLARGDDPVPAGGNTHPDNLRTVRTLLERLAVTVGSLTDDEADVLAAVRAGDDALQAAVAAVAPASGVDPAVLRQALAEALASIRATTTLGTA